MTEPASFEEWRERARHRLKRGCNALRVTLHHDLNADVPVQHDVVALDDAVSKLAQLDPQQERIVELRFLPVSRLKKLPRL